MEHVTLKVKNKEYKIGIAGSIKEAVDREILLDFPNPEEIDIKSLVTAYIKQCIKNHKIEDALVNIDQKLPI